MDKALSAIAFLVFAAFLGILGWYVFEIDLTIVIALTVVLLGFDLWSSAWGKKNGGD